MLALRLDWRGLSAAGVVLACAAASGADPLVLDSPFRAGAVENSYSTSLSIAPDAYRTLARHESVFMADFALTRGESVDLQLDRVEVFAPDARLVLGTDQGDVPMARPDLATFSGQVVGQPDSRVFLAITPNAVNGVLRIAGEQYIISSGPIDAGYEPLIYKVSDTPEELIRVDSFVCHFDELVQPPLAEQPAVSSAGLRGGEPCRIADIAVETDFEFRQIFGDESAASAYAGALIGAVSEIYAADTNMQLRITYLRIWNTSGDPWTQGDTVNQLYEFQDYWNLNETGVTRHVATFLSGRGLGGGVAYGGGACYPEFDYSLSANLAGWFPYPLEDNNGNNWDLMVVAHEFGHNFGAPHTHDIGIDNCAGGDCSVTPNGTIMSYCHLCSGGLANIVLNFHPFMLSSEILPFLNSGQCDMTVAGLGDINGDCGVDITDLGLVLSAFGTCDGDPGYIPAADLDGSGCVNISDLGVVLANFGL